MLNQQLVAKNNYCCVKWVSHTSGPSFFKFPFYLRLLFSDKTFQKIFCKLAAGAWLSCLLIFFFDSRIRPLKHYWGQPQCSMWALWCCPIRPGLLSALSYILDAVSAADASACRNKATQGMSPVLCMLFDIDWSCAWIQPRGSWFYREMLLNSRLCIL